MLMGLRVLGSGVQVRTELILPHVEYIQKATIPERLLAESHLLPLIQINRNPKLPEGQVTLWSPGIARLAVAGRSPSKDALDGSYSWTFPALEFLRSLKIAQSGRDTRRE